MHIHKLIFTYINTHTHTHTYITYIHRMLSDGHVVRDLEDLEKPFVHTCTYINIHAHTYTYIHIYKHTYTNIHTYTECSLMVMLCGILKILRSLSRRKKAVHAPSL